MATTVERVPRHTALKVNQEIHAQMEERVQRCANQGDDAIEQRLRELDREWDVERTLEANAATAVLVGVGLGAFVDRRFFALPAIVGGFLLQHAIQGWCPPLPVFRRIGFRTQPEIAQERYALKALRGDFENMATSDGGNRASNSALVAVQR